MSLEKAVTFGLAGEKLSRTITGTSDVSVGRSAVATGAGATLGAIGTGSLVVGATVAGASSLAAIAAPLVVPVAVGAGVVSLIRSLFD
jgi:hypothetical protein